MMRKISTWLTSVFVVLLLCCSTSFPACAEGGIFSVLASGVSVVFDTVKKWDSMVDALADVQLRHQVKRKMSRLDRDMSALLNEKRQMRQDFSLTPLPVETLEEDLFEVRRGTERLTQSMIDVNDDLKLQTSPKIVNDMVDAVGVKSDFIAQIKLHDKLTPAELAAAKANLQNAIVSLKKAQGKLDDCMVKLH